VAVVFPEQLDARGDLLVLQQDRIIGSHCELIFGAGDKPMVVAKLAATLLKEFPDLPCRDFDQIFF